MNLENFNNDNLTLELAERFSTFGKVVINKLQLFSLQMFFISFITSTSNIISPKLLSFQIGMYLALPTESFLENLRVNFADNSRINRNEYFPKIVLICRI